jgi:hypothetical protein
MNTRINSTGKIFRIPDHRASVHLAGSKSTSDVTRTITSVANMIYIVGVIALLATTGCSGSEVPTVPVKGTVTLRDGTVVETGTVEFNATEGDWTARGTIKPDGTFYLSTFTDGDGAVPGTHDAVVVQLIATEDLPLHQHDHGPTVDPRYAHYDRSGLQYSVTPDGENHITIQVDSVEPR